MTVRLQRGSHGPEVRQLQALLNRRLFPPPRLGEDGDFGLRTEVMVRKFQAIRGLSIDGIVGARTWAALQSGAAVPAAPDAPIPANFPDAPWMAVAQRESGQREVGGSEHNPRIIEYHGTTGLRATTDETPWCSSFVNWCLRQVNITGTDSAAAASWLRWGQSANARAGAITVIYNADAARSLTSTGNHVGFLVQATGTHYLLLGGNQGNRVRITPFAAASWQLKGYRWPT